ncbi:hypothetical protein [Liquorilactobacillus uvarum]|nr:hypothetical protein [Liquorilactobacillus uvarum]
MKGEPLSGEPRCRLRLVWLPRLCSVKERSSFMQVRPTGPGRNELLSS